MTSPAVTMLPLAALRLDGGTQPRAMIGEELVRAYADDILDGATFPPVVAFYDGASYWLADGFHRQAAHEAAGRAEIAVDVRQGTRREAILFSVGANAAHGLRRTAQDKRRAALAQLGDPEWVQWSDSEIARRCAVSHTFVAKIRPPAPVTCNAASQPEARTYTTRHGTVAAMKTAAIGVRAPATVVPACSPAAPVATPAHRSPPAGDPPPSPPARPRIFQEVVDHGWITAGLVEIEKRIELMPAPQEAVRLLPSGHRHEFTCERLQRMAAWLAAFAANWPHPEKENDGVAAL